MSGNCDALALKEEDVKKILACGSHLGTTSADFQMEQYVYKRRPDGTFNNEHLLIYGQKKAVLYAMVVTLTPKLGLSVPNIWFLSINEHMSVW